MDFVDKAVQRCPFLHDLSVKYGEQYARNIAVNPCLPADKSHRRPIFEEADDFQRTLRLFHGPDGAFPLPKLSNSAAVVPQPAAPATPASIVLSPTGRVYEGPAIVDSNMQTTAASLKQRTENTKHPQLALASAPFAAMSFNFFGKSPDFGDFFKNINKKKPQPKANQPKKQPNQRPKPPQPNQASASSVTNTPASQQSSASQCPLRKLMGPYAHLIFSSSGHIQCPAPIIKARAALAQTKPVRDLRPQGLPVKLLAVGATSAGLNVPCGMWREHCEKFSVGWFIAVHATIPFVAMIRKAVIMPKYAIILTIAAAVAGQAIGARIERECMLASKPTKLVTTAAPLALCTLSPIEPQAPAVHAPTVCDTLVSDAHIGFVMDAPKTKPAKQRQRRMLVSTCASSAMQPVAWPDTMALDRGSWMPAVMPLVT